MLVSFGGCKAVSASVNGYDNLAKLFGPLGKIKPSRIELLLGNPCDIRSGPRPEPMNSMMLPAGLGKMKIHKRNELIHSKLVIVGVGRQFVI